MKGKKGWNGNMSRIEMWDGDGKEYKRWKKLWRRRKMREVEEDEELWRNTIKGGKS